MKTLALLLLVLVAVGCDFSELSSNTLDAGPCDDVTIDPIDYSHACDDYDPCTFDWFGEGTCHHDALSSGAYCENDTGESGSCADGLCEVKRELSGELYADAVCNEGASAACVGADPYVVNRLEGSCFWEWCNVDGDSRTLRTKPAGSPCVYPKEPGSPEFIQGQCSPCGTCL